MVSPSSSYGGSQRHFAVQTSEGRSFLSLSVSRSPTRASAVEWKEVGSARERKREGTDGRFGGACRRSVKFDGSDWWSGFCLEHLAGLQIPPTLLANTEPPVHHHTRPYHQQSTMQRQRTCLHRIMRSSPGYLILKACLVFLFRWLLVPQLKFSLDLIWF